MNKDDMGCPEGCTADKGEGNRVSSVSSIDMPHGLEYPLNPHPICDECGEEFSEKRFNLGYRTCLNCGAEDARIETIEKFQRIAVLCNKSSYQYICKGDLPGLGRR
jgi:hypothetical protein